jgi:hypothetical protein
MYTDLTTEKLFTKLFTMLLLTTNACVSWPSPKGLKGPTLRPNRPDGSFLSDSELYTRGTIGLYVSKANVGPALTQTETSRLRALLAQFLPINLRAVVIVVAPAEVEFVYKLGSDIGETYSDVYPFAETLEPIGESSAVAMPGLFVLQSNTLGDVSARIADPSSLRGRTFFPPLQ